MFHNADLIIYGIVNNFISKFNVEDYRIIIFTIFCIIFNTIPRYYKNRIFNNIKTKFWYKPSRVSFENHEDRDKGRISHNFQGIMNYINENSYARETKEITGNSRECKIFQVNQDEDFLVQKEMQIYGTIHTNEREIKNLNETKFTNSTYLTLYSYKSSNKEIIDWVRKLGAEEEKNYLNKFKTGQKVFEIFYKMEGPYERWLDYHDIDFFTNISFKTNYLPHQEEILERLNFFENKDYFKDRGLKRNLNFLFSGEPGTGKTAMLKAIAKHTERHLISIKLDKNFPARGLEKIFYGQIKSDVNFDLNKVIFIIEEIDLICDFFKKRKPVNEESEKTDKKKNKEEEDNNADLGVILNILDGCPETDGRIIVLTLNDENNLDTALKRPGRTEHYHFERLNKKEIVKTCQKFWKDEFTLQEKDIKHSLNKFYTSAELTKLNITAKNDVNIINKLLSNN